MKRIRQRVSLLAAIRLSIGMVLFSVLWASLAGKSDASGGVAFAGLLVFLVAEAFYAGETNHAIEVVNIRVDDRIHHDIGQDARLDAVERELGIRPPDDPDVTPPYGTPIIKP